VIKTALKKALAEKNPDILGNYYLAKTFFVEGGGDYFVTEARGHF
jgi:hypothetical protein